MNRRKQFMEGLLTQNPVLVQVLGMCSTMAITTSFFNGLGMGVAVLVILTLSNVIISAIRKIVPDKIRIAMFIVVIAGFVTIVGLVLQAFIPALSSALGGTYNKICLLAREYEDKLKIHVIDTKITCFGEGLLAIKAAEFAAEGMSSEDILKEIRWMMKHQIFMGVDGKLDYLIYNGRLKGGKAFLGQMLNMCPVIHFSQDGEITPLETVRTPKKALARTCELLKERLGDRDPADYLLWHIYTGPSLLETLKTIVKLGYRIEKDK